MQTSPEANQSIQTLQFSAAEAGSIDQRRLGLSPSNVASIPTSLRRPGLSFQQPRLYSRRRLCLMRLVIKAMVRRNLIIDFDKKSLMQVAG
jgi:hypothetical protein